ncbi:MAG TPA: diversity-generating retroelement protein Avd [Gemmataceae bacterium]|nr:diversity-generating retroelement protein Avd [Gemmataceae bacterium]
MANDLKVISDCYDLAVFLSRRVEKFPRSHRYTLGADIERRVQGLLGELVRARYAGPGERRTSILGDVNVELEVLRFQVRLAKDLNALPVSSHGEAARQLEKVGAQVGGWLKSSRPKG